MNGSFYSHTKNLVRQCKFYGIPNIGIYADSPFMLIYWLEQSKIYLPRLEADITDKCNLKCKGCYHFSNFSLQEDFYPVEDFSRDIHHLAQTCDIISFRLMGGEPLLSENLDEYIKILRQNFPHSDLRVLTNGLLIPSLPQKILDAMRENRFIFDITNYPPTAKILDKITEILRANKISYKISTDLKNQFNIFLTLHTNNAPSVSQQICGNAVCRTVRKGKIYKCPIDAFRFKVEQKFGIENYPKAVDLDIYSQNFSALLQMLDDDIDMCSCCSEKNRFIEWEPTNNPKLEDWLADPNELKNLL